MCCIIIYDRTVHTLIVHGCRAVWWWSAETADVLSTHLTLKCLDWSIFRYLRRYMERVVFNKNYINTHNTHHASPLPRANSPVLHGRLNSRNVRQLYLFIEIFIVLSIRRAAAQETEIALSMQQFFKYIYAACCMCDLCGYNLWTRCGVNIHKKFINNYRNKPQVTECDYMYLTKTVIH